MILLPLEKGAGGILKQTTFHTQVTFGNENFMLGKNGLVKSNSTRISTEDSEKIRVNP